MRTRLENVAGSHVVVGAAEIAAKGRQALFRAGGVSRNITRQSGANMSEFEIFDFGTSRIGFSTRGSNKVTFTV